MFIKLPTTWNEISGCAVTCTHLEHMWTYPTTSDRHSISSFLAREGPFVPCRFEIQILDFALFCESWPRDDQDRIFPSRLVLCICSVPHGCLKQNRDTSGRLFQGGACSRVPKRSAKHLQSSRHALSYSKTPSDLRTYFGECFIRTAIYSLLCWLKICILDSVSVAEFANAPFR